MNSRAMKKPGEKVEQLVAWDYNQPYVQEKLGYRRPEEFEAWYNQESTRLRRDGWMKISTNQRVDMYLDKEGAPQLNSQTHFGSGFLGTYAL